MDRRAEAACAGPDDGGAAVGQCGTMPVMRMRKAVVAMLVVLGGLAFFAGAGVYIDKAIERSQSQSERLRLWRDTGHLLGDVHRVLSGFVRTNGRWPTTAEEIGAGNARSWRESDLANSQQLDESVIRLSDERDWIRIGRVLISTRVDPQGDPRQVVAVAVPLAQHAHLWVYVLTLDGQPDTVSKPDPGRGGESVSQRFVGLALWPDKQAGGAP